jgi:hypothetical protein
MVTKVRLHFEGDERLRSGFRRLFSSIPNDRLQLIATGGKPIQDYAKALRSHPEALNLLLLDSDELPERRRELGRYPQERIFWMIELMEAWFLADREALKRFYRRNFNESALPGNSVVENIRKHDVITALTLFSKPTQKGPYHKTKHAPFILASLDPDLVRKAAPECERLFTVLTAVSQ